MISLNFSKINKIHFIIKKMKIILINILLIILIKIHLIIKIMKIIK